MSAATPYQVCVRCVMDTSDPEITFDARGCCNHCRAFDSGPRQSWLPNEEGARRWAGWVDRIRADGRGREYDCIIGLSGGVDSAYLAWRLRDSGLRMLAVHVDGGWNSEVAVGNIERIVKSLKIDLSTFVVDWEEMRDLQVAFLRASVANQDVPQDHAFFAQLYRQSVQYKIGYFLSGGNLATECILPSSWGYNAMDRRHLSAIHSRFGTRRLKSFPRIGFFTMYVMNRYVRRFRVLRPLDFMNYDKMRAKAELAENIGWRDYGEKHHESRFTKFFQSYYLPVKFGFDKRRAHLSSMVVTGQISRAEALATLEKPSFNAAEIDEDKRYLSRKLGLTLEEFEAILALPPKSYRDYPSNARLFALKDRFVARIRR